MSMSQEEIVYYPSQTPVPYEATTVKSQGFLDMMALLPMMFVMFLFMMLMGLMRDIAREPGAAKQIVIKTVEAGKEVIGAVVGR